MSRVIDLEQEILQDTGGPSLPPPPDRGGGDWQPHGRRGPNHRLRRYRIGLFFAVVSIYTLFIAITSAYVVRQSGGTLDTRTGEFVHAWRPIVLPSILWLNTVLLFVSSLTLEFARRQLFREPLIMSEWLGMEENTRRASLPWLGLTIILGFGFLIGQYLAWRGLNEQGVYAAGNPAASFFFVLTAAHAVHLLGGLISLLWAAIAGFAMSLESRQIAVDITGWYWHAMGALWIYILALLHWMG
jgi:cytochrome c oxidase subunit III